MNSYSVYVVHVVTDVLLLHPEVMHFCYLMNSVGGIHTFCIHPVVSSLWFPAGRLHA